MKQRRSARNQYVAKTISYVDFNQVVLAFQVDGRIELLSRFRRCFLTQDTNKTGTVSRSALLTVLKLWNFKKVKRKKLIFKTLIFH